MQSLYTAKFEVHNCVLMGQFYKELRENGVCQQTTKVAASKERVKTNT